MKLYTFWRSSAAYRVRIALNVKELRYTQVSRQFENHEHRSPEYLIVNPQGLIPALDAGPETGVLAQSLAIIEYLDEICPAPPMLPESPRDRAVVRAMAQAVACDIHPVNNLRILNYLREPLGHDDQAVEEWVRHWIVLGFEALEIWAQRHSIDHCYMFGDRLSVADVCLVPQVYNARRFGMDLSPWPTLQAIAAHLETLPAVAAARPEAQPDAP